MTDANRVGLALQSLMSRQTPDGSPLYSADQVRDAFALEVMRSNVPAEALSMEVKTLLARFATKIGFVGENASPDRLKSLLEEYRKKNPIPDELSRELSEALRG